MRLEVLRISDIGIYLAVRIIRLRNCCRISRIVGYKRLRRAVIVGYKEISRHYNTTNNAIVSCVARSKYDEIIIGTKIADRYE